MRTPPPRLIFGVLVISSLILLFQFDGLSPIAHVKTKAFGSKRIGSVVPDWLTFGYGSSMSPALLDMEDARHSKIIWGLDPHVKVPETQMKVHAPGWTVFDNMYLLNGTLFVVTDEPENIPDRLAILSSGYPILNEPEDIAMRSPTDADLQVISREQASQYFGTHASRIDGATFLVNDPPQFITHYFHFSAELMFGLWRAYSTLDPSIPPSGLTALPPPRRIMFRHTEVASWRDYSSMNQFVVHGAFPSAALAFQEDWKDRADTHAPFVFDRVVIADRSAAMHSPMFALTQRTASGLFRIDASPYWWHTVRNNMLEFTDFTPPSGMLDPPKVITYISRQEWGRRMLRNDDHANLILRVGALSREQGYEFNIVSMDQLSRKEQFQLAARTTIMMGVHGNGLTALLWMSPTPRSTVMEFFYPQGFAHDYEFTSRVLGIKHYGFWNDEYFTAPETPAINYPEGFQGNDIPLDGEAVARLCHMRLSMKIDEKETIHQ